MKNKVGIALVLLVVLLFSSPQVTAGIMIQRSAVKLSAGEKKTICNALCLWEPQKKVTYVVRAEGLGKFLKEIKPSTISLRKVPCPKEPQARRKCIIKECNNPQSDSAVRVCLHFAAPLEFAFDYCNGWLCKPKVQEYRGAIRAYRKVGAAIGVEPTKFIVYYTPLNGWPILFVLIAIAAAAIASGMLHWKRRKYSPIEAFFRFKRKYFPTYITYKWCKKCKKRMKAEAKFCSECGEKLVEKREKR